jgi:hypothetical protein
MMFVGIQANEGHPITEEMIVEFFCKEGYSVDDDFIYQKENEVRNLNTLMPTKQIIQFSKKWMI